jgi:flavorubredoxin
MIAPEGLPVVHTGMRAMYPEVRDAIASLIDLDTLRWIGWSHFDVDECGALNEWLAVAPRAQAICSEVGAMVNVTDFLTMPSGRPSACGRTM